jgi:hypothetical protein
MGVPFLEPFVKVTLKSTAIEFVNKSTFQIYDIYTRLGFAIVPQKNKL